MAQSTEIRDRAFPPAQPVQASGMLDRVWGKTKLVITRTVFWSYERGSWQYDLLVLAILLFIFLMPRGWFNDRPTLQLTALRNQQGLVELIHDKEGWHYLVDARLVESLEPAKPEDAIQDILRSHLKRPAIVKSIVPFKNKDNVLLYYTVVVTR
jgi:hypothetical protein